MGKIKKILENELLGGTQSTDVYPITSTQAVYDENNEKLSDILNRFDTSTNIQNTIFKKLFTTNTNALYNNTSNTITRTDALGKSVEHLPGCYYLNGLGDITEEQMMKIYNCPHSSMSTFGYSRQIGRTFILTGGSRQVGIPSLEGWFVQAYNMESLVVSNDQFVGSVAGSCERMFSECSKLKKLYLGNFTFRYATSFYEAFSSCTVLEDCYLKGISKNISFKDSPNLSKDSLLYIINNAAPTSSMTITLHPNVLTKVKEDGDIIEALSNKSLITLN